jgi:serine protease Do
MMHTVQQFLQRQRFWGLAVAAVALPFFLMGLVVATGFHWTGAAEAERLGTSAQEVMTARSMPGSFADLVQQLTPTVVNIKVAKAGNFPWPQMPEGPLGEFFKRFYQDMPRSPKQFKQQGTGSGVIISADGYIATNHHVVDGAEEVTVTLADQRELKAQVVGRDAKTDLAVLKVEAKEPLPVASLGDSEALRVGDWVIAIGNPFGLTHTVTAGIVSAKDRVIGAGPYDDFIQTDASINPGNSGGPLFDTRGEVVGINTAIVSTGQGIGFAIPINVAQRVASALVTKGKVVRGWLGVSLQPLTKELAQGLGASAEKGAVVARVLPGGPAEKAGLVANDVIVKVGDVAVEDLQHLQRLILDAPVGESVTVRVLRNGKEVTVPVTIAEAPSERQSPS